MKKIVGDLKKNLFVNGRYEESLANDVMPLVSPVDDSVYAELPVGCAKDVDRVVASARQAHADRRWCGLPPSRRKNILLDFAQLIEDHGEQLDSVDAFEMGKPLSLDGFNAKLAANEMRFCGELSDKLFGEKLPSDNATLAVIHKQPIGVVAAITPWNFPTFTSAAKVAPALAAGNAVIVKPSEYAVSSTLMLAELAMQAGIPEGVFNVITGLGSGVGSGLAAHMEVDMVSFTGSTMTGKKILQSASESNLKKTILECGGKSPQIVFADATNLEEIANYIVEDAFMNSGQVCSAGTRLLVDKSIANAFVEQVVFQAKKLIVGNPFDKQTNLGPLVNRRQLEKVFDYVSSGIEQGASLALGEASSAGQSCYMNPCIFIDVRSDMKIAQEEIFGPVLSVMTFDSIDEAIALANSTIYGLTATIWTSNAVTAHRVVAEIEASSITANFDIPTGEGAGHGMSDEPFKLSGCGVEYGFNGLNSYLQSKAVCFNYG